MHNLVGKAEKLSPEDFQLGMVDVAVRLGNPEHVRQAFSDWRAVTEQSRVGEDTRKMLEAVKSPFLKALESGKPADWLAVQGEMAKYPRAGAHSMFKAVPQLLDRAIVAQLPPEPGAALRDYAALRAARPDLPAAQVWARTVGMKPGASAFFEQHQEHVPFEVKAEQSSPDVPYT